jgi:hypothetical protein
MEDVGFVFKVHFLSLQCFILKVPGTCLHLLHSFLNSLFHRDHDVDVGEVFNVGAYN